MINAWFALYLYYEAEGFVPGLVWLREHGYKFTLQLPVERKHV